MTAIKHDIWQDPEELTMLCFSDELGEESRTILEPNSKIIHSFYADSHFDAMTKYYAFMDWGIYTTEFEMDKEAYDLNEISSRSKTRVSIDKILWNDWDPIGVNEIAPRDEYQSYVQQILYMVCNDNTIDEIAERLFHIEKTMMGMPGDRNRCNSIAEKIILLKQSL